MNSNKWGDTESSALSANIVIVDATATNAGLGVKSPLICLAGNSNLPADMIDYLVQAELGQVEKSKVAQVQTNSLAYRCRFEYRVR